MGEKIKTLAEGKLFGSDFEIELNHHPSGDCERYIHIQSDKFRMEMAENEYIKYALLVVAAGEKLKRMKGIK